MNELTGKKFGRLTALRRTGEKYRAQLVWLCQCDCGVVKSVPSYYLTSGGVVSCGCYGRSLLGNATRTHGGTGTPEKALSEPVHQIAMVAYQGVTLSVMEWARRKGVGQNMIRKRIQRGWTIEAALSMPSSRSAQ